MDMMVRFCSCILALIWTSMVTDANAIPKITTFDLYFDNTSRGQRMVPGDAFSFLGGGFDSCKKTVFIVTGFNQPDNHKDIMTAARLIAEKQYNTIIVNFETLEYFKAPISVGRDIADFLKYLTAICDYDRRDIILIGVSLGVHIVGMAGNFFPGIGRIIAVDPAGPFYDLMPEEFRISRSSANYVDVLHCSKVYGSLRRDIGHVNLVLNGGLVQPGCPWLEPGTKHPDFACNHLRGAYLLLASLSRCQFRFARCQGYVEFMMGLCKKNEKLVFGLGMDIDHAPRDGGFYYYNVAQLTYPYCTDTQRVKPNFTGRFC